ncbi:hypothetical protein EHR06_03435 [Leptospira dzoumogneensis]|uniref:Glycosyltransferase RgtA/B/C/D-like domain-containing protein n=1 Tax=Leptospira dzoumogneensis TaxID=2484904 RepID=A0A4Z1ARB9_9LEPT|nr:hypothetical protein EHR06_03435 [Leptospira dzoumogneensis]
MKFLERINSIRYSDLILAIIFFCYLSYQHAWISDDAFISFRVVDNFANGYGLRWNIADRVQVFTNPLLVLLLLFPYIIWNDIASLSFITSFFFGIGTLLFLKKIARSKTSFLISVAFLFSSKAFFDYMYSGLENSLNYLIQAAFFYFFWKDYRSEKESKLPILTFLVSLAIISRMDFVLIFVIPSIYCFWKEWKERRITQKTVTISFLASIPLILWFLFAAVYYGSLLPNTYYAKTNITDSLSQVFQQGFLYYYNQIIWDPISLIFLPFVFVLTLFFKNKQNGLLIGFLFSLPYLIYILLVGGDFMAGRFFTYVILMFGLVIANATEFGKKEVIGVAGLLLFYNLLFLPSPIHSMPKSPLDYVQNVDGDGIVDEKRYYFHRTGFQKRNELASLLKRLKEKSPIYTVKERIPRISNIGFIGFSLGPKYHIVDHWALPDPLLSRLKGKGRIGHKIRWLPKGYMESLESNSNMITEEPLREYYEGIRILTIGSIWDRKRWDLFWKYQFGSFRKYPADDYVVDKDKSENSEIELVLPPDIFKDFVR